MKKGFEKGLKKVWKVSEMGLWRVEILAFAVYFSFLLCFRFHNVIYYSGIDRLLFCDAGLRPYMKNMHKNSIVSLCNYFSVIPVFDQHRKKNESVCDFFCSE